MLSSWEVKLSTNQKTQKKIEDFLKRLFAVDKTCKESFQKLSKLGCSEPDLAAGIYFVCHSALLLSLRKRPYELSKPEVRRLATDLRALADRVDSVNGTPLSPKLDLLCAPPDPDRDPKRKHWARLYENLPGLMRAYSFHLERFAAFSTALRKRKTAAHFDTVRLLMYTNECTDQPQYESVSSLLTAGFLVAGGTEESLPAFFSADALAKLYQRTAHMLTS